MRNALWPDSLDNHIAEIEEFFIAAHKTPGFTEVDRAVCLPKKLD
jgi:hypothetical protein